MTKLADLKEGDCFISPVHGGPVHVGGAYKDPLPCNWNWVAGINSYISAQRAVYEKTDLTLIEHYSTHPTPTPKKVVPSEPDKRWVKDTEVRTGDRFYGYRGVVYQPAGLETTKPYDDGPIVTVTIVGKTIMHPSGHGIHKQGDLGSKVECLVSRDWTADTGYDQKTVTRVREAAKMPSFSQVSRLNVPDAPSMIPGDKLNGVSLEEIVRRYELGMREERIVPHTNGKKYIRDRKALEVHSYGGHMLGLDHLQFAVAQKEFTRLVKAKGEEARKADKELVKVDRDTDYWNE